MRKVRAFLIAVMAIWLSTAVLPGSAFAAGTVNGKVIWHLYAQVGSVLTTQDRDQLVSLGWIPVGLDWERQYMDAGRTSITIGGKTVKTNSAGQFSIDLNPGTYTVYMEGRANGTVTVIEGQTTPVTVDIQVDFLNFEDDSHEIGAAPPDGSIVRPAGAYDGGWDGEVPSDHNGHRDAWYHVQSYVTCNRFNGYQGNQWFYYKWAHKVDSMKNFTLSDCDLSAAQSLCLWYDEVLGNKLCRNFKTEPLNSARCSINYGHRPLYHAHTYDTGPSGY